MAIDLASSSSSYGFKNMFDVLAAVASEKFENEIPPNTSEAKTSNNVKKQVKKSATSALTFEDIKCMQVKLLIEKFSEMTSDELTKKYSYKCILLPQKCTMFFQSFGNEKKACDKMKSHLQYHIEQLTVEYESNKGISDILFVPKSPNSNSRHSEKLLKKSSKKQQMYLDCGLPQTNFSRIPKKTKNSTFSLKTEKKKLHGSKKCVSVLNNGFKIKGKNINSVYLKDSPSNKLWDDNSVLPKTGKYTLNKRIKTDSSEESDEECDSKHYNSYSKHLKIAFYTDVEVKEDINESPLGYEQISNLIDCNSSYEEVNTSLDLTANTSFDRPYSFLQDHNYVCSEDNDLPSEFKNIPRKYEDPLLYFTKGELPPYVIKTPPFPFIHIPLLPEVAEIIEIRMSMEESSSTADKCSYHVNHLRNTNTHKSDTEEFLTDESMSDHEEKYADGAFGKVNGTSGSVLECVENLENKKYSSSCVPKNEISSSENDENFENPPKNEKELALKYIAKLHSKGKKKISDSLICQICPGCKHFTAQATLIHHYRSHAGIKPYICTLCSAKFTRQHSLNYHMLIHQNLSRFTCDVCGRTFRHPSHYKEHLRRHTGETPYHCPECNLHFKTRNTFKRHLKTRHGKLLTAGGIEDLIAEE